MKIQKIIFAFAIATLAFAGCKPEEKKEIPTEVKEIVKAEDTKKVAINISGMTCEIGCAKTIESKLSKHEGVLNAKVVFNDSIATVKYDASKTNKASLIAFVGGIAGGMYNATEVPLKSCSAKKSCAGDCKKECCKGEKACSKNKDAKSCEAKCKKECCKGEKACSKNKDAKSCEAECKKECCKDKKA